MYVDTLHVCVSFKLYKRPTPLCLKKFRVITQGDSLIKCAGETASVDFVPPRPHTYTYMFVCFVFFSAKYSCTGLVSAIKLTALLEFDCIDFFSILVRRALGLFPNYFACIVCVCVINGVSSNASYIPPIPSAVSL